jgi:DNA-binding MarR family transcriptional regulator
MQHNYRARALANEIRDSCLGVRVGRLNRLISRRFDQELRHLGLTISQVEVLTALTIHGGAVKPAQLAEWLGTQRSTISRNLALLDSKGLVTTVDMSSSGRSMAVAITDLGTRSLGRAGKAWRAQQSELLELLGDDAPALLDTWIGRLAGS